MSLLYGVISRDEDTDTFIETIVNVLEPGDDDLGLKIYTIISRYMPENTRYLNQMKVRGLDDRKGYFLDNVGIIVSQYLEATGLSDVDVLIGNGYLFIGITRYNIVDKVVSLRKLVTLIDDQAQQEAEITLNALGFNSDQIDFYVGPADFSDTFAEVEYNPDEKTVTKLE